MRFLKALKKSKKGRSHSQLKIKDLVEHFSKIIQDNVLLSNKYWMILNDVNLKYLELDNVFIRRVITSGLRDKYISKLKPLGSHEIDGITTKFLINEKWFVLYKLLYALYSVMFIYNYVPFTFNTTIKIQILNPSVPSKYWAIIVSFIFYILSY